MDRIDHILSQRALIVLHLDSPVLQLFYLSHHSLSVIILGSGISYLDNFHSDVLILGGMMRILSNCMRDGLAHITEGYRQCFHLVMLETGP